MTRKIVKSIKDSSGAYQKVEVEVSIDSLLSDGLDAIFQIMDRIKMEVKMGTPSRETVMNLKDIMSMLHSLKDKEMELLEDMSDEDLAKIASDK